MSTYTPKQFSDLLQRFGSGFPQAIAGATYQAAQQLNSDITGRIFGQETKDIEGGTRGYRSEGWVTKREDAGLSINRVNLQYKGSLKKSPELMREKKAVSLKIVGSQQVKKARGNERWYEEENGAKVFEASKKEEANAREVFAEAITDYIQKYFTL